jgi:hypothetical protein
MARWRPRPRTDPKAGRGHTSAHHGPVRALECRGDGCPDDPSRLGKRRRGPPLRCGGAVANGGDYSVKVVGHAMPVTAPAKQSAALRHDSAGAEGQGDSLAGADRGFGEIRHRYASRSARPPHSRSGRAYSHTICPQTHQKPWPRPAASARSSNPSRALAHPPQRPDQPVQ